jgi:hypothetical protein
MADARVLEDGTVGPDPVGHGVERGNDSAAEVEDVLLQRLDLLLECGLGDHASMVPRPGGQWGIEAVHPR